jgi:hypothetical protein
MPISALGGSLLGLLLGVMLGLALYAFLARPGEVTRASLIASVSEAFPEPLATGIDDEAIGASCGRRTRARWRCELSDASGGPSVYDVTVTRIARAVELSGETDARVLEGCV